MTGTAARRRRWPIVLIGIALLIGVAAAAVLALPIFGAKASSERLARMQADPHFHDGRFVNDVPPAGYTFADVRALVAGQFLGDEVRTPPMPMPVVRVDPAALKAPPGPGLRAFWIGHASVYVELDGVRMLIDPIFSEYASPFSTKQFNIGPRRFHPPPIALADLPKIDAVLITHDHYDHLDMPTVQHLARGGAMFFVPLGIGAHLVAWGVPEAQITDLAWWQEAQVRGVRIVSTPSRHYSGRGIADKDSKLWTSWSVLGAKQRFYVSGDTGYSDHFAKIGERFGPFDMAFMKIGAYGPGRPWLDIHMTPEESVRGHVNLRARRMFPVHWATFKLAFHEWNEPVRRALVAARSNQVEMVTPRVGEWVDADRPFESTAWWNLAPAPAGASK